MPVQRLADATAATRSAEDTGAASSPEASLHLKLAQEELARAKSLIHDGNNERADFVLIRAKSDAELALAEAREQHAADEAQHALDRINEVKGNLTTPTSTTTTTSSTIMQTKPQGATGTSTTTTTTQEKNQ